LLFCITQIICLRISHICDDGKLLVEYKRQWARNGGIIKAPDDKDLVFFLGHSKILSALIPELFDRENAYGTCSYNLALPGLPLAPHYFMLKDYLEKNKPPKYVILLLNPGITGRDNTIFSYFAIMGARPFEVLQYALIRKDDIVLNYLVPSRVHWGFIRKYFVGKIIRLMPKAIKNLHKYAYSLQRRTDTQDRETIENLYKLEYIIPAEYAQQRKEFTRQHRGYSNNDEVFKAMGITIRKNALSEEGAFARRKSRGEEKETDDPFVVKFFELAKKHNIKVILISPYEIKPREGTGGSTGYHIPEIWENLRNKYGNIYFSKDAYKPKFYEPQLFRDDLHLTARGKKVYAGNRPGIQGNRQ
jgi:hypothetical protein